MDCLPTQFMERHPSPVVLPALTESIHCNVTVPDVSDSITRVTCVQWWLISKHETASLIQFHWRPPSRSPALALTESYMCNDCTDVSVFHHKKSMCFIVPIMKHETALLTHSFGGHPSSSCAVWHSQQSIDPRVDTHSQWLMCVSQSFMCELPRAAHWEDGWSPNDVWGRGSLMLT